MVVAWWIGSGLLGEEEEEEKGLVLPWVRWTCRCGGWCVGWVWVEWLVALHWPFNSNSVLCPRGPGWGRSRLLMPLFFSGHIHPSTHTRYHHRLHPLLTTPHNNHRDRSAGGSCGFSNEAAEGSSSITRRHVLVG